MSLEHYISAHVLEAFEALIVSGVSGRPDGEHAAVGSLVARVLCSKHNSLLSPLDTFAGTLFRCIRTNTEPDDDKTHDHTPGPIAGFDLFDGHSLERWCLKVLIGSEAGRVFRRDQYRPRGWAPPDRWLRILFGVEPFASEEGLYFGPPSGANANNGDLSITPVVAIEGRDLLGIEVALGGLPMFLALSPREAWEDDTRRGLIHRVSHLVFDLPGRTGVIGLGWHDGLNRGALRIKVMPRAVQPTDRPVEN